MLMSDGLRIKRVCLSKSDSDPGSLALMQGGLLLPARFEKYYNFMSFVLLFISVYQVAQICHISFKFFKLIA